MGIRLGAVGAASASAGTRQARRAAGGRAECVEKADDVVLER